MADTYLCAICQTRASCVSELHLHQTSCHSITQLSLALLTYRGLNRESKKGIVHGEENNQNVNKANDEDTLLQSELSECVLAMNKIFPNEVKKEGRRKKNPRPRRNCKRTTKRKESDAQGNETSKCVKKTSDAKLEENKPIQQPYLSSTIKTPNIPKRMLRKKALINYYDLPQNSRVEINNNCNNNSVVQKKTSSRNTQQNNKNCDKTFAKRKKNTSDLDKGTPLLKSALVDKAPPKNCRKYKLVNNSRSNSDQNYQLKENLTWNRVYQNYVQSFETFKESVKIQENFMFVTGNATNLQPNIENRYIFSPNPVEHMSQPGTSSQYIDYYNINPNRSSNLRNSDTTHYPHERTENNIFINKTNIDQRNLLSYDLRNVDSENNNGDSNVDNFNNISLTNDVKDIIVEFLEQEENERTRNPYWEDNMDKYFPSETESSSEVEQFNDQMENSYDFNSSPLNLVISNRNNDESSSYDNISAFNNTPAVSYKEFAKCKSTWSSDYIKHQQNFSLSLNGNNLPPELSTAYKYKLCCINCGEYFCNECALAAHFTTCKGKLKSDFETVQNEKILDDHIYDNFYTNKITPIFNPFANDKVANYYCDMCKKEFVNRTKYCKHMLSHKKKNIDNKVLCSSCGLMLGDNKTFQNHMCTCNNF